MNLRVVKKDIDFLVDEFLSDALISLSFASENEERQNKIMEVINSAIDLRDETLMKINHPDKSRIKAYYRETNQNFLETLDKIYDDLSAAVNAGR